MKKEKGSEKLLINYYAAAKEAFIAKMKTEDDEKSNLKFKIASFVIHQLSQFTPSWFKGYFLSNIAKPNEDANYADEKVLKVENDFYDAIADYLLKMESEVDYVGKMIGPLAEEWDKKEFWKPIVFDAFLIVGIYFTSPVKSGIDERRGIHGKPVNGYVSPRYLYHVNFELEKNIH